MTIPSTEPTNATESRRYPTGSPPLPLEQEWTNARSNLPQQTGSTGYRAASAVEWLGLVAALVVAISVLGTGHPGVRLFSVVLAFNGAIVYLLLQRSRSLDRILRRRETGVYGVPVLAAGAAWLQLTMGANPVPAGAFLPFVATWTAMLAIGRHLEERRRPPLRLLLIGSPSFREELEALPNIGVMCLDAPPNDFRGWDVVVTDPLRSYDDDWLQWISHADMFDVKVLSAPLVLESLTERVPTEMLQGRWALEVLAGRSRYLSLKRVLDVVGVVVLTPLVLPVCVVVALMVWLDIGRPVLFWQQRIGLGGRPFRMVKFRTMANGCDEHSAVFASVEDSRATRIGRFLRRHRLDEVPQFWNVLKGEMSLIGPRPEQTEFAREFQQRVPLYDLRHTVLPGLSGWAQVRQGYTAGKDETETKLRFDFYYVKRCSLALDAVIVWRTAWTILTGFGSR